VGATPTKTDPAEPRPDLVHPLLAAAMSHPTRVQLMTVLGERVASPRQLAEKVGEPLNNVTYHVNQLRDLGCIELVRTERRAGGRVLEHFYRSARRGYFDDAAWEALTEKERFGVTASIVRMISKDLAVSMASGAFFAPDAKHISRWPMAVDEEGWHEISAALARTAEELFEIEERVAARRSGAAAVPIHAKVELMQFRSPPDA
jgi:DNA-binding transcriptional ArsR family regulator